MTTAMVSMAESASNMRSVSRLRASEDIPAGAWVVIWMNGGEAMIRMAVALDEDHLSDGFVRSNTMMGAHAFVYHDGVNDKLSGLTPGARYYLSDSMYGQGTTDKPPLTQYLGRAISATEIVYQPQQLTTL